MLAIFLAAAASIGDDAAVIPNPDSVQIPNLAADAEKPGNEKKFFVFHRTGAIFREALADFRFCFRYVGLGLWNPPPSFVPWVEENGLRKREETNNYGLVGALIGGAVVGGLERSVRQINMTSCMLPRGYTRYAVSESMWRQLNGKDTERSILMQAKIASGPVPPTPRVAP